MVIKYLASRADVRKVIVFDAPMSEFDLLKRRQSTAGASQDRWVYVRTYEKLLGKHDTDKISYNVFVHPPGKFRTREDDTTKPSLLDAYTDYLREVFQRESVSIESAVFWLYPKNYLASGLVKHFRPAKVVVDVVDDHRAWPGVSDAERERLTVNYRETLAIADMAFVNCGPMQQSMSEFCSGIRLVPNGCDLDPPRVEPRGSAVYDAFKAWPGKTIGFVGNLEAKIDIELIRKIAHRFDDCQIVLLGSTHANPAVRHLEHCANVRMPGVIPYEQLGAWMSRFDVGIVPHLDLPMTKNMNPLKMYVYLAANLPVVSTEIFNIDRDSELVRVARSHSEFLEQIAYVLKRQQGVAEGQVSKYVASNSWARRFEAHVDELHRR
jgi:glycosyltransferase involved in cell wall biosynthesis